MIRRYLVTIILLACSVLLNASERSDEFSMLAERENYFNDPAMTSEEQTLFTFAAYNAGPGRVKQLRKEATEMGLDPNLWFDNVEVVAAKRIGRETVQYVSNIYKYWVAYQLAFDINLRREQ